MDIQLMWVGMCLYYVGFTYREKRSCKKIVIPENKTEWLEGRRPLKKYLCSSILFRYVVVVLLIHEPY